MSPTPTPGGAKGQELEEQLLVLPPLLVSLPLLTDHAGAGKHNTATFMDKLEGTIFSNGSLDVRNVLSVKFINVQAGWVFSN